MLASAFVLVNGIVFSRSNGLAIQCLIARFLYLKEVKKVLWRNSKFEESYNVKCFKEINHLKSPQKGEAYLEPKQTSTIELFYDYT